MSTLLAVRSRLAGISASPLLVSRGFCTTPKLNSTIPFRISGQGVGVAQTIEVKDSPHKISVDAYPSFGGQDAAPSPLAYNLSSLSSCTQVTGSLVAKDHGVKLGRWKVSVNGELDPAVLTKGVQGNGNWSSIELIVNVQTDAKDDAAFQKFTTETERRCPVTQLFKNSGVKWSSQWVNEAS
ncbi:hypothetical protein LTR84_006278 [Exophiala bonariae]|uniref:Uncharacterized protein n=1 Tax=Exophiala bonariae TaxID=1690606 RepID=A0AAV9N494_9EURO|nr:hypothetical protein LTR84_006278 [Exophiala bonariae]